MISKEEIGIWIATGIITLILFGFLLVDIKIGIAYGFWVIHAAVWHTRKRCSK